VSTPQLGVGDQDAVHTSTVVITAYRGVNTSQVTPSANTDANTTCHTTPALTVQAGSWVASFWAAKSTKPRGRHLAP